MVATERLVVVGRIAGLYGLRGWVHIHSHTRPRANILEYEPWSVGHDGRWQPIRIAAGRAHGKGVVARLEGYEDRDAAAALVGLEIAVRRDQMPALPEGEFYWTDLEGLQVRTCSGIGLGHVDHLMATGANDVMVVKGDGERLIPFLPGDVVKAVNLDEGWIEVDWDPAF